MSGLVRIAAFALTVTDPERLAKFYVGALGFVAEGEAPIPPREAALVGGGMRRTLRLGEQTVHLDRFEAAGSRYPAGSDAAWLGFQHLALVTTDIDAAWAKAAAHGAVPISTAPPVTLPKSSGGVRAAKFRDPEGHPLELLEFPSGSAPEAWRRREGLTVGIDHSAISVSDADASDAFYARLGLVAAGRTLNQGPEQAALDGLEAPVVDVVPMRPRHKPPHLELLGYRGRLGRPRPELRPADIAATRIIWDADQDALLPDPDGHLHVLLKV